MTEIRTAGDRKLKDDDVDEGGIADKGDVEDAVDEYV